MADECRRRSTWEWENRGQKSNGWHKTHLNIVEIGIVEIVPSFQKLNCDDKNLKINIQDLFLKADVKVSLTFIICKIYKCYRNVWKNHELSTGDVVIPLLGPENSFGIPLGEQEYEDNFNTTNLMLSAKIQCKSRSIDFSKTNVSYETPLYEVTTKIIMNTIVYSNYPNANKMNRW